MFRTLIVLLTSLVLSQGRGEYRFDYEFNNQADGWLKFHVIPAKWQQARMRCHAEGAVLASPLSKPLKAAIIEFVQKQKKEALTTIFTGVHATLSKGDYTSVEGVPLLRLEIDWAIGEPDNYANTESCLAMVTDRNGSTSDVSCSQVLPYVCYKKYKELTMTECGTTDPAYTLDVRTGSCYKYHTRGRKGGGLIWAQAFMTCQAEGGHLLILNSELEAKIMRDRYSEHPHSIGGLIGFHDWGEPLTFLTIHGETLESAGYEKWVENNPDNTTHARTGATGESCGGIFPNSLLNDCWCTVPMPFICEKSRTSLI